MKVVTGVLLVGLVALAAAALPALGALKPQTISITSVEVQSHQQGSNIFIVNDNDYSGKTKVGQDTLTCNTQTSLCDVVVSLAGGNILAHFKSAANATSGSGQITGGTKGFAGATGTLTYKNLNAKGTRTAVTLKIT